jgi:hypothetical protein
LGGAGLTSGAWCSRCRRRAAPYASGSFGQESRPDEAQDQTRTISQARSAATFEFGHALVQGRRHAGLLRGGLAHGPLRDLTLQVQVDEVGDVRLAIRASTEAPPAGALSPRPAAGRRGRSGAPLYPPRKSSPRTTPCAGGGIAIPGTESTENDATMKVSPPSKIFQKAPSA